jgi:selenide,water dikinase
MTQLNSVGCSAALAVGVNSMTDITGFGLVGHANEMAQASGVTVVLELSRLPLLPGAIELARQGNQTRASASNRRFVEPVTRMEGQPDKTRLEFVFDAQTSGGLLISVAADRADELVAKARAAGATLACVIGSVTAKQDVSVVIRG